MSSSDYGTIMYNLEIAVQCILASEQADFALLIIGNSAKDTPDTLSSSSFDFDGEGENSASDNSQSAEDVEYEPRSLSDSEIRHPFTINESFSSSSNDEDIMIKKGKIINAVTENTSCTSTSSTDDLPERFDPELSLTDYWFCVKCRTPNNNPLFRFCEKCFGDRKNFFPPRPKPRTKKRKQRTRRKAKRSKPNESGSSSNSSQPNSSLLLNSTDQLTSSQSTLKGSLTSNSSEVENSSVDASLVRTVVSSKSISCQTESNEQWPLRGETCETCMARPKDGVFIHTNIVHRYSCYKCSMKIWKEIGRCPLCNNKVCNVKKIAG
ncbi:E3 ubiquitin-protein ligase Mdm2 isoform X2 [Nilaparvata lugens]|uniref:E3 ubiquitin-protein ligase Mdm2 isoform X2 n=1 Tax=Nilaparvata lugens TaxID=108931 RepID=UPI00193D33DC|nr:E3 ubiquitin-protein ligase Mdm2 isoform X2 [Nilaparvata lugens]